MLKMKKNKFMLSSALISISTLALVGIAYSSHMGNITKKDKIRENAINTITKQDFSGRSGSVTQVIAGRDSWAVIIDGKLYTWGSNSFGELGHGHTNYVQNPSWVEYLGSSVTSFDYGMNYAGAINSSGLYMWGNNSYGQLGTGDKSERLRPKRVISGGGLSSISCGWSFDDADQRHSAVVWSGYVYTWGTDLRSRLGHHNSDIERLTPSRTSHITQSAYSESFQGYTALTVSAGALHTVGVARMSSGNQVIYSFGDSDRNCQIAFTVTPWLSRDYPTTWDNTVVDGYSFNGWGVKVDATKDNNIAMINNRIWTWGNNEYGKLGRGLTSNYAYAAPIVGLTNINDVSVSQWNSYAVAGTSIYGWGWNLSPTYRQVHSGGWSKISASQEIGGNSIGIKNGEVWMWNHSSAWKKNTDKSTIIELNASNDPNGYRNSVVYNLDADAIRKLVVAVSWHLFLPVSYTIDSRSDLGATPLFSNMVGQTSVRAIANSGYWFFTNYVTFLGFLPAKDTKEVETGNMVLTAKNNEVLFENMGINQIIDDAKKNDESSKLATWIYTKSNYTEIFNPNNFYTQYFPRNTKITGISEFEYFKNITNQSKWDIRFKITVDKYYKQSGNNWIEWNNGPDLALNKYVTITNLPQVTYEEDIVDENKNLVILNTRINHNDEDISDADKFFNALTGNPSGGKVTNIGTSALIRKYIDIRFIPDWYYDSDLKTKIPNNIYITRNSTEDADTETVKHIKFMIMADKYFTNYGELKSGYVNTAKFKIERNTSDIQQIENTQELTKQYTTGDFIDLLAPNNATTGATVPNNNINTKIAKNYLKFINFPGDTIYDLITTDAQNENEQGKLTFKASANQYYIDSKFELQKESKTFDTFTLDGFKPSYDISVYPIEIQQDKISQIHSSANFYDEITNGSGSDVNIDQISQYFTMQAIPHDANLSLIRLDNNDSSVIKFQMTSDRYADNGGRTIKASITREFEIKVASVDTTLIIILVSAGVFLIFLIWALIVTIKNKRSVEIQHGAETI